MFKQCAAIGVLMLLCFTCSVASGQGLIRDRLRKRFSEQSNGTQNSQGFQFNHDLSKGSQKLTLGGLQVAVWQPAASETPAPLVIFSHGFHGINTQSAFLMKALAQAGYIVVAPNHRDALGGGQGGGFSRPEIGFAKAPQWSDRTHRDRGDDIANLLQALRQDPAWNSKIDWSKVALSGHSLGGYTALALAGAWPTWKLPGIKAVLALSPYCEPFIQKGTLRDLHLPVMYEGGTRDFGITPTLRRPNGAFAQTSAPAYLVDFDNVGHFFFSDLNRDNASKDLICRYSVEFLNKYVKGEPSPSLEHQQTGVVDFRVK